MPKSWLYYIALFLPLVVRFLVLDTNFDNWLWYHGYQESYYFFSELSVNPRFLQFVGGWPLPVFVITVVCFWAIEVAETEDDDVIAHQFLLLPLMYVPFTVIGDFLITLKFQPMNLFAHPVVIIPFGYIYVFIWVVFIRVMHRMRLVL